MEALKKKLALKSRALRDGNWPEIALVWGYSITWAFLTDWAKVRVYHHFDMETTRHQDFLRIVQQSLHHHAAHTGLR